MDPMGEAWLRSYGDGRRETTCLLVAARARQCHLGAHLRPLPRSRATMVARNHQLPARVHARLQLPHRFSSPDLRLPQDIYQLRVGELRGEHVLPRLACR